MDPYLGKTISWAIGLVGAFLAIGGYMGQYHFGKQINALAPYKAKIRTASATVEVTIASRQSMVASYLDRGGYIIFAKGGEPLLTMASSQSTVAEKGEDELIYRGLFNMDVRDPGIGKPVEFLKEAEYAQICFLMIPKRSQVLAGKATCILNSAVQIDLVIPPEAQTDSLIFVRNLEDALSGFPK